MATAEENLAKAREKLAALQGELAEAKEVLALYEGEEKKDEKTISELKSVISSYGGDIVRMEIAIEYFAKRV